MVRKERSHNKLYWLFLIIFSLISCNNKKEEKNGLEFYTVDVSGIPLDTISISNIIIENGIFYLQNKPFSGFVVNMYPNNSVQNLSSFLNGKLHGISKTYYENGQIKDVRSYKNNLAYGRHYGFWENNNKKFDFFYIDEKSHGIQRQWYPSGTAYLELNYLNDSEEGTQKAWRQNGKLFANYVVKDGIRYGLQKSALCYTLKNGRLK